MGLVCILIVLKKIEDQLGSLIKRSLLQIIYELILIGTALSTIYKVKVQIDQVARELKQQRRT